MNSFRLKISKNNSSVYPGRKISTFISNYRSLLHRHFDGQIFGRIFLFFLFVINYVYPKRKKEAPTASVKICRCIRNQYSESGSRTVKWYGCDNKCHNHNYRWRTELYTQPEKKGYRGIPYNERQIHKSLNETALYHFGTDHTECNVLIIHYLYKNTEETRNHWPDAMITLLFEMNESAGKYEKTLLNRMEKYSHNHLLFLHDFSVLIDDYISVRDLQKAKNS